MKRTAFVVFALLFALSGCSLIQSGRTEAPVMATMAPATEAPTEEPSIEPTDNPTEAPSEGPAAKGVVGSFEVEIVKAIAAKTNQDKPAAIVQYKWKNNSDKTTAFVFSVMPKVTQNGVECKVADGLDPSIDIDVACAADDVEPGKEQTLYIAYAVQDESDITVAVAEMMSFDEDAMVVCTLKLEK